MENYLLSTAICDITRGAYESSKYRTKNMIS